jgi:hypothetical protein
MQTCFEIVCNTEKNELSLCGGELTDVLILFSFSSHFKVGSLCQKCKFFQSLDPQIVSSLEDIYELDCSLFKTREAVRH